MVCFDGIEILDAILNDGDVAGVAVGRTVALEVEGAYEEAVFGYGDSCELGYPAAVAGVAVDHGDKAFEEAGGIMAPCLSKDLHVLFVEHEGLLVEDSMLFEELFSGEVSIWAVFVCLVDGVKSHFREKMNCVWIENLCFIENGKTWEGKK